MASLDRRVWDSMRKLNCTEKLSVVNPHPFAFWGCFGNIELRHGQLKHALLYDLRVGMVVTNLTPHGKWASWQHEPPKGACSNGKLWKKARAASRAGSAAGSAAGSGSAPGPGTGPGTRAGAGARAASNARGKHPKCAACKRTPSEPVARPGICGEFQGLDPRARGSSTRRGREIGCDP